MTFTCPCRPGFTYASRQALNTHKKSQRHQIWEARSKSEQIDATHRDNRLLTCQLKLKDRDETIEKLQKEIVQLNVRLHKLMDDNRILKKSVKKFVIPPQTNLIDL